MANRRAAADSRKFVFIRGYDSFLESHSRLLLQPDIDLSKSAALR
jgi:hypothetical protein